MPAEPTRILEAEARDGYRDRVVIGGLAAFMRHLAAENPQARPAAELLLDYAELDKEERVERLCEAQRLLRETP
ncbi:MAG TPA: hypothetical protein VFA49_15240, partial [Chloroflexota bacterium]|nr:hypothetical protein [Chloroflexota bacterium]